MSEFSVNCSNSSINNSNYYYLNNGKTNSDKDTNKTGEQPLAAEVNEANPSGEKSVPWLDSIIIALGSISRKVLQAGDDLFVPNACADEGAGTVTDDELIELDNLANSETDKANNKSFLNDITKKPVKNSKGEETIKPWTIFFSDRTGKKLYIEQSILPYFRSEKYPLLVTISKILSSLDPNPAASFGTPQELSDMFRNYQTNCNRYNIYALLREDKKNPYQLIKIDGILGRQTAKSMVFVYELGQLAVRFQIVKSFRDYVDIFNNKSNQKLKFKDIVKRIEDIGTRLQQSGTTLLNGEKIDNMTGDIMNNVGNLIIELHAITNINDANLQNIAAQKNKSDDKSVLVLPYIKQSDAMEGTNYPAMREAKMLLHVLGLYLPDAPSIDIFDGTWDSIFDKALKDFGITNKIIDSNAAAALIKKGQDEYAKVKATAEDLYLKVNDKKEIEGGKKTEIRTKLDNISNNYEGNSNKPETIAKSIIELRKINQDANGLLGTINKKGFLDLHKLLSKKYEDLTNTVVPQAGDLVKTEEKTEINQMGPVIDAIGKRIDKDEWKEHGIEIKKSIDDVNKNCSFYIVNLLIRIFNKKAAEIEAAIKSIDLDSLPEDDKEFENAINRDKKTIGEMNNEIGKLNGIITTLEGENLDAERLEKTRSAVKGLFETSNAKSKEIDDLVLFLPLIKQRRKLVRMVNDAISEVSAFTNSDELKNVRQILSDAYTSKVKDDYKVVADQKQMFNKNNITAELKTVNEPGRQANAILSLAQDLTMITDEKRKGFLATKITPEIKRLIDAIDARITGLNYGAVDIKSVAPVSPLRATEAMKWRYLVFTQIYIPCTKPRIIFESDKEIPEGNKKVMPFILSCYKLQKNNKKYNNAAKALYDKVLTLVDAYNAEKYRVTNRMGFEDAMHAELEGGIVSIATMCLATVIAGFKKVPITDKWYTIDMLNGIKIQTQMFSSVNKQLYEVILNASETDFGKVADKKVTDKVK